MNQNPDKNQTKSVPTPPQTSKKITTHPQKNVPDEFLQQIPTAPQV